jgi:putative DNA methylase
MAKTKQKSKAEQLQEAVAEAVGAGQKLHLESVDFSDPNRPKTCLEVDFPIININRNAAVESSSGAAVKPVYKASKWWARRSPSVFRAMLLAAAAKAPDDPAEAAKLVWDSYYGNHQENEASHKLKVADIFMGGGTTIVEGARLGMQMYGNDLNPVAWLVVKNELAQVTPEEVKKLLDAIEVEVKPQIMPFYACDCPRGHKGKWTHKPTRKEMGADFDPLSLTPEQRPDYQYEGPEVIYTFWAKHGPCQSPECNHRTPIMSSPVIAVKTLTVKAWTGKQCQSCGESFDIEQKDARMAPAAMLVVADNEPPFAVMDGEGNYACPHCGYERHDQKASNEGESSSLGKSENKKIELTLLVHPDWLKGSPGKDANGDWFGGSVTDTVDATAAWNKERAKTLKLIEVRGNLPETVECPDSKEVIATSKDGGTVPGKSKFKCQESTCGREQDILESIKATHKTGPVSTYAVQGYCPKCDSTGQPYNGRFFSEPSLLLYDCCNLEWHLRSETDLESYYPKGEVPYGFMTHMNNGGIPNHGFTHWHTMFNSRQLLVHSLISRKLASFFLKSETALAAAAVLGAFQQYLRFNCMFTVYHSANDQSTKHFANNNYAPKSTMLETPVFSLVGDATWTSAAKSAIEMIEFSATPWETLAKTNLQQLDDSLAKHISGKSTKVYPGDPMLSLPTLFCGSATALSSLEDSSIDLVVTDPPFGGLLHYSELSDFFYVWLRIILSNIEPEVFAFEVTPKSLEAVSNRARNPDDADKYYQRLLTASWAESHRILKPAGLLAFTFHHSEDEPWVAVLESLFQAGFVLEVAYPVRSDTAFADQAKPGAFGSQQIEYDIIHVCRKRIEEPVPISWARLRRQIMSDVRQLQEIIEQHQKEGLGEADLQVIRRGKALEYYSRHYGKVYIEKGREDEFTVKDALVGINQLLDDETDRSSEPPPVLADPYTRQFLRLFRGVPGIERGQIQKFLRGTGVSPSEFEERGWCKEEKKVFTITHPLEWAREWKGKNRRGMSRDFDQAYFLLGASYEDSGIRVSDTLNSGTFDPHPAVGDILDWFAKYGSETEMTDAAKRAKQLYSSWQAKNKPQVEAQQTLFDLEDGL